MKMTAEEIVKVYKADPRRETMLQLAHENECTMHEIGEFLKNAAAEQKPADDKKPARSPKSRKKSGTKATKKDKEKKVILKVEPAPQQMPENESKKERLPKIIQDILYKRLELIREKRRYLIDSLDEINDEEDEITRFLRG